MGSITVVPACVFTDDYETPKNGYSIEFRIYRKYLEEIFGEFSGFPHDVIVNPNIIWNHDEISYLTQRLNRTVKLLITGFALDLLNLRPEICTLLLIDDPSWEADRREVLNFQILSEWSRVSHYKNLKILSIHNSNCEIIQKIHSNSVEFVPVGAAAFWLGVEVAKNILQIHDQ